MRPHHRLFFARKSKAVSLSYPDDGRTDYCRYRKLFIRVCVSGSTTCSHSPTFGYIELCSPLIENSRTLQGVRCHSKKNRAEQHAKERSTMSSTSPYDPPIAAAAAAAQPAEYLDQEQMHALLKEKDDEIASLKQAILYQHKVCIFYFLNPCCCCCCCCSSSLYILICYYIIVIRKLNA